MCTEYGVLTYREKGALKGELLRCFSGKHEAAP